MATISGFEVNPRGGSDAWDEGAAGAILSAEAFGAPGPAEVTGTGAGVLEFVGATSGAHGVTSSSAGSVEIVGTAASFFFSPVIATAVGVLELAGAATAGLGVAGTSGGSLELVGAAVGSHSSPSIGSGTGSLVLTGIASGVHVPPSVITPGGGGGVPWMFVPPVRLPPVVGQAAGVLVLRGHAAGEVGVVRGLAAGVLALEGMAIAGHGPGGKARGRVAVLRGAADGWSQHPIEDDFVEALLAAA